MVCSMKSHFLPERIKGHFLMNNRNQRSARRHKFGRERAGRPFQRSAKITIFTFRDPPATLQKPSSDFRSSTSPPDWLFSRFSVQNSVDDSFDVVENIRAQVYSLFLLSQSYRFYLILWDSSTSISTDSISTFSGEAYVQCATWNLLNVLYPWEK